MALSSCESEYMAACCATQEALWLRYILEEIGISMQTPLVLYEDNQAAIKFSKNQGQHRRTKHVDLRYHFVRERVNAGDIVLEYISTHNQLADILTKALDLSTFCKLRDKIVVKRASLRFA